MTGLPRALSLHLPADTRPTTLPALVISIAPAGLVGALVVLAPPIAVGLSVVFMLGAALLAARQRPAGAFLGLLAVLLLGYAFLGRGLAHVGTGSLYVGEAVLVVGLLALVLALPRLRLGVLHGLLAIYMLWGLARTVPYLGAYGLDALRDAVTWGYALFAVALSAVIEREHLQRAVDLYRRVLPAFLLWIPIAIVLTTQVRLPAGPGSGVPIVVFKGGDMGVHLAGVAAFILVGLYRWGGQAAAAAREALLWLGWLVATLAVGAINRGGLVAASSALAAMLFGRSSARWFSLALVVLSMGVLAVIVDPRVDIGGQRDVSVSQVVDNIASIVDPSTGSGVLQGSKDFRVAWWGTIIDYTIGGPHFWDGKGFGINIADDDGFQTDGTLRAPHNGHMTILARTGVPGLLIWIVLQAYFGWSLLRASFRAAEIGAGWWLALCGWLFVYWLAALVNMSFDPYLEGPQGGIWFWTIFGLGMAAMRIMPKSQEPSEPPGGRDPWGIAVRERNAAWTGVGRV